MAVLRSIHMIDLKFLGCGAAFYPVLGNTNAVFEKGDTLFFIDFGETAFQKVFSQMHPEKYEKIYVLLTHVHADHCGSLSSLCSYMYLRYGKKVRIIHPTDAAVRLLDVQATGRDCYEYYPEMPSGEAVRCQTVPVKHVNGMDCFGYYISDEEETIFYSGDTRELCEEACRKLLSGEISRVYHDTASYECSAHCCYTHIAEAVPEELRRNVWCMHLDGEHYDLLRGLGFSVAEPAQQF